MTQQAEPEAKKPIPTLPMELLGFLWQYGMAGWGLEVARKNPKVDFRASDFDGRKVHLYGFRK